MPTFLEATYQRQFLQGELTFQKLLQTLTFQMDSHSPIAVREHMGSLQVHNQPYNVNFPKNEGPKNHN